MSLLGIGWYMASIKTERLMRTQDLGIVDVVTCNVNKNGYLNFLCFHL